MLEKIALATFAASFALPAQAQAGTSSLRQALGQMPELLLTNPDPIQISFFDPGAFVSVQGNPEAATAYRRMNFGSLIAALDPLQYGDFDRWEDTGNRRRSQHGRQCQSEQKCSRFRMIPHCPPSRVPLLSMDSAVPQITLSPSNLS